MGYTFYHVLMLAGALQGFVFAAVIFLSSRFRTPPLYFLAGLILCISLNNLQYFVRDASLVSADFFFSAIYVPIATLSAVFYFFYVKCYLFPNFTISTLYRLLFLPFLLFFTLTLVYKFTVAFGLITPDISAFFGSLIYIHEAFAFVFSALLLGFTVKVINQYRRNHTAINKEEVSWLQYTTGLSLSLCLLYGICIVAEVFWVQNDKIDFRVLWICHSFTIYWLGHIGIYHYGLRQEQQHLRAFAEAQPMSAGEIIPNTHVNLFRQFIEEEKNYLDSELTLERVAQEIGLSKSYLSRLINSELGSSYTDYINGLRVEQAKIYIKNPDFQKYTLMAIGLEAGFNSKSAFNTAFRKTAGCTPSEYRKSVL